MKKSINSVVDISLSHLTETVRTATGRAASAARTGSAGRPSAAPAWAGRARRGAGRRRRRAGGPPGGGPPRWAGAARRRHGAPGGREGGGALEGASRVTQDPGYRESCSRDLSERNSMLT